MRTAHKVNQGRSRKINSEKGLRCLEAVLLLAELIFATDPIGLNLVSRDSPEHQLELSSINAGVWPIKIDNDSQEIVYRHFITNQSTNMALFLNQSAVC